MKYLIVQNGNVQLTTDINDWEVAGSAETIGAAKDFIREQALLYFEPDSIDDDLSNHCMSYAIYELKAAVRPMPKINVSLTLKNIAKELQSLG